MSIDEFRAQPTKIVCRQNVECIVVLELIKYVYHFFSVKTQGLGIP